VRVALGAQRSQVLRMVLWDALKIVLGGMAVGLPAALLAARLLRTQLYGVGAADPLALAAAVAVLLVSGAVASLAPALRASRIAPAVALRAE
jgi:ABC-type antimicrobial peptide transport system permease subunit